MKAKELKLIGSQFKQKVNPDAIIGGLEVRKSSQDCNEAREMLLYLQRKYHDLPSKRDLESRLKAIKQRK